MVLGRTPGRRGRAGGRLIAGRAGPGDGDRQGGARHADDGGHGGRQSGGGGRARARDARRCGPATWCASPFVARTAAGAGGARTRRRSGASRPGNGQIDHDGGFVADLPGTYRVARHVRRQDREAVVEVRPRDVRRPTTLVGPAAAPVSRRRSSGCIRTGSTATSPPWATGPTRSTSAIPGSPVITDSVVVDARHINDLMTTEDGKFGVLTREGASTRRNGIVILSFEDPAHPKPIAEFTETVTGGVHSTFIYRGLHLSHRRRDRLAAGDRHPRSVSSAAGGAVGDVVEPRGQLRARRGREGRARLPQLLERRAGHPRRRQRGRRAAARSSPSWSRSTSTISTRCTARSRRWAVPGSSAARTRRGGTASTSSSATRCSPPRPRSTEGSGVNALGPRLRAAARDRRLRSREAPRGGLLRAEGRRRPQRLGRRRHAVPGRLPGRAAGGGHLGRAARRPAARRAARSRTWPRRTPAASVPTRPTPGARSTATG